MPTTNSQIKRKKSGPKKSRPPARTGAQASPTFSPSNPPQPPAPQTNGARPNHPRDGVLQSLAGLTGTTVNLITKTAIRYEGVVASTTTQDVTLRDVKDLTTPGAPLKDAIFIASTNIEGYTSGPADSKPVNAFRTDTGLSQKKHNNTDHERHDDAFGAIGDASWDQFVVNAELFGVTGSFNDDDYTTNTNLNLADFKELALEAQRISAEILGTATYDPYQEEYGIDDSSADEEDKYGAVVRGHNVYIPHTTRRGATGSALPSPSSIVTISTTAAPTTASNEVPKASVNGPNGATISQSQSPPEESPSPAPGAADDFHRDFLTQEKQRLKRKRLAFTQSKLDKRKAELVMSSQNFKLDQPIPKDIAPILAKDGGKQRQITEKAKKDSDSGQARAMGDLTAVTASRGFSIAAHKSGVKPAAAVGIHEAPAHESGLFAANPPAMSIAPKLDTTVKKIPMVIQPIRPFRGSKTKPWSPATSVTSSSNGVSANGNITPATVTTAAASPIPVSLTAASANRLNAKASPFKPNLKGASPSTAASRQTATSPITPGTATTAAASPVLASPTAARPPSLVNDNPSVFDPSNATSMPTINDFQLPSSWLIQNRCRFLLLQILKDHDQQAQIHNLSGDDAQTIVNYLDIVFHEVLDVDERRRMLSLLCRLAKSTRLFPRCYMLSGIEHTQETIAGGSFADIWRGKHGEKHLCLKVIRVYRKQESDNILRTHVQELALWAHLSHANILPFYGVYLLGTPTPRICLVSPWMERGNLRDYLDEFRQKPRLPFISDIVNGLAYLHGLPIVHSDIKAQNVLVSEDERALITDFGLSSVVSTTTLMPTGGTTRFMPPELITGDGKVTKSCDIWSFACLCYEILTNELPFYQYKDTQIVMAMLRKEIPRRPEQVDDGESSRELDEKVWNLLMRCWDYEPRDRPDCEAIQETLKDTGFQDNRPEATTKIETGFFFWQAMKEQSGSQVDYGRVADILLPICSQQALAQDLG